MPRARAAKRRSDVEVAEAVAAVLVGRHPPNVSCYCSPPPRDRMTKFCASCETAQCGNDTFEPCRVTGEPWINY